MSDDVHGTEDDSTTGAQRGDAPADGKTLRKAELDALRARVREEHGDDVEAFLTAVFDFGRRSAPPSTQDDQPPDAGE